MAKGKEFKRLKNKNSNRFKVANIKSPPSYDYSKPIFSFKYMNYKSSCCISTRQKDKKSLIIDKLVKFSQLTWKQIINLPKKNGFEKMPAHRFKVPLPQIITPEVTMLVTRYDDDGGRLAGFRVDDIYHIVLTGKKLYPH